MHPLYVHPLYDGVRCTTSVSFRVGSKLPLPVYADVRHSDGASHPLGLLSADTFHHHGGDHNQACKAAGAQDSICQFLNAIVHVNLACTCRNMRPPLLSHPPPFVRLPFGTLALFMHVSSPLRREGNVDMCTPLRRVYSFFFFFLGGQAFAGIYTLLHRCYPKHWEGMVRAPCSRGIHVLLGWRASPSRAHTSLPFFRASHCQRTHLGRRASLPRAHLTTTYPCNH